MTTSRWRGPGWRLFDADPGCGKTVRDWIRYVVASHPCPADPEDAGLVSTELFTNAVMHGPPGGRVLAGYVLWQHGARIVMCDGGGATIPRLRESTGLDEGGRGLHVVDALSAQWGSFRAAQAQVVWCDLGQPLDAAAGEAWAWLTGVLAEFPIAVDPEHLIAAPKAAGCSVRRTCGGFPAEPSPPGPSAAGDRSSLIEHTARSADQQPGRIAARGRARTRGAGWSPAPGTLLTATGGQGSLTGRLRDLDHLGTGGS